ncbi:sensor histidine kinase [Chitinophaga sancti]|uniref:Histidine kinase n=1 Tax=Chitinophaga sancti TaxID=1004 RepID=A0A1K1PW49_9BACT|nr:histidine kinase [Chitinophaga sancti]WQD61548.1 histidine kinase [Chitinophaga sancti]WQG92895.1 histidine kinase [Chitinophaga sancti]SFW51986.1 Histidine kinase [Chitinophaga sancti]
MINLKQLYRNRLFNIGLHIAVWTCFLFFPFFIYRIRIQHPWFFAREIVDNLFLIGVFYLNFYFLIPRFFTVKKIAYYLSFVLLSLIFVIVQQAVSEYVFWKVYAKEDMALHQPGPEPRMPPPMYPYYHERPNGGVDFRERPPLAFDDGAVDGKIPTFVDYILFPEILRKTVFAALLMLFMSGFIKIAQEWFKSEQQREALKLENLNAELKFLKSQINPHFLFNCLNTIYSLAHKHSVQTEHAIIKLSTIMRYMIYESNEDKVQLQQELQYLEDYIDIQRLRLPEDIVVEYAVQGSPAGLRIEPMLLVPFVENAFKHGISYAEPSFIAIAVAIERNQVRLVVENAVFKQRVAEKGGIGLQNVKKRLDLLYTEDHELEITEAENQFIVDLKIELKNDQVYSGG